MSVIPFPSQGDIAPRDALIQPSRVDVLATRDRDLVARVESGDRRALVELLDRYWEPLNRYAQHILSDRPAAEDVVQEVFLRLWQGRLDIGSRPVRIYFFRVTRNLALDELRRRTARAKRELDYARAQIRRPATPDRLFDHERVRVAVTEAIQALPARRREAFTLVYLQGMSYEEVSEVMGVSTKTIGNHISDALSALRQRLRPLLEEMPWDGR